MAQTKEGALKIAASKSGVSVTEYLTLVASGLKRCTSCKLWQPNTVYNTDRSRYDGLCAKCQNCTRVTNKVSTKGRPSFFKGRCHTDEAKTAMRLAKLGKSAPHKAGVRPPEFGAKVSASQRSSAKIKRGSEVNTYKDGKVVERRGVRFSAEYRQWRYDVFSRDAFTCRQCGDGKGGNLNAHHIKAFADFPELRFSVDNGLTLCETCHGFIHTKPDSIRKRAKSKKALNMRVFHL